MTEAIFGELEVRAPGHALLTDRFVIPPFSVLDTRQGYWQERRRAWLALGIESELGRGDDLLGGLDSLATEAFGGPRATSPTTSIFDPVLCELVYRWFMPEGGTVLDPFAGGSVRGIVAAMLGHAYTGIDLSSQQVAANSKQAQRILSTEPQPNWMVGDSRRLLPVLSGVFDLVFTCPPYYDLEVYSDDPLDLSHMSNYADFIAAYRDIIAAAAGRLRADRFMVLVVSEIRDKHGFCRGLVPDTINLARDAGLQLYNEAVLVNSAGTLPLRVGNYMEAGRKLGRCHQNVLVFAKGDPGRGWSYERPAPPAPQLSLIFGEDE